MYCGFIHFCIDLIMSAVLDKLAKEYTRMHVHPFKKIAERSFRDGYEAAMKEVRQRLEVDNTEFDYGHNISNQEKL